MLDVGSTLPVLLVGVHLYVSAQRTVNKLIRAGADGMFNVAFPAHFRLVALVQHDHVVGGEEVFGGGEGGVHINGNMGIVHHLRVAVAGDVGVGDHGILGDQVQRPGHVLSGHLVAVVEIHVIAQGEVPFLAVLAVGPLGGDPGLQRIGGGVVPDQGVIQGEYNQAVPVGHGHVVGHGNDIGNFGADADVQHPVGIAVGGCRGGGGDRVGGLGGRLIAAARTQAANENQGGKDERQIFFHNLQLLYFFAA